jgi:APA family basic amino acid/polyamine antiporter
MQGVTVQQKLSELPRTLGLVDGLAIVVGCVIGGGIFLVPNLVAQNLATPASIISVWVFAGVASFFGALACAELGAAMPSTGGQYVFLTDIYGPMAGFLFGWTSFVVCRTAQASWLAVTLGLYVSYFVPLGAVASKILGIAAIAALAAVNYCGVARGALVQKVFTSAKLIGLLIIIGSAFLLRSGAPPAAPAPAAPFSVSHFGIALIACLLAYDGWAQMSDVAGEIKNPRKNVMLALGLGVAICISVYVLANAAYLHVLSIPEIAASGHVGAAAADRVLGRTGGMLVAGIIVLSIIGALNGAFMTSPRIFFAQAHHGLFFSKFAEVHPQFRTPAFSIVAQAVWSMVLLLSGTYQTLIAYAMMAYWFFYGLMVLGVMVLRVRRPELERPYKMWGYPVTPLLFLAVTVGLIANTLVTQTKPALASFGLIAAGVPVYFFWRKKQGGTGSQRASF